jgi:hypothetical protein
MGRNIHLSPPLISTLLLSYYDHLVFFYLDLCNICRIMFTLLLCLV